MLFGFRRAAAGGAVVQRFAEHLSAEVLPVVLREGQVLVPHLVHRFAGTHGVAGLHGQEDETPVFAQRAPGEIRLPAVFPRQPLGKGEGRAGFIERKRLDPCEEFLLSWGHK